MSKVQLLPIESLLIFEKKRKEIESIKEPRLQSMIMFLEPYKGKKSPDVHLSFLLDDWSWIKITSKEIVSIEYDNDYLMVTTIKKKLTNKTIYLFLLPNPLNLNLWEKNVHLKEIGLLDFLERERISPQSIYMNTRLPAEASPAIKKLSKSSLKKISKSKYNVIFCYNSVAFNEGLNFYIMFMQEFPTITKKKFKELLNDSGSRKAIVDGLGLDTHIVKNFLLRHRCMNDNCEEEGRKKCSGCVVMYCDEDCQRGDWLHHRDKCEAIAEKEKLCQDYWKETAAFYENFLQDKMKVSFSLPFKKCYFHLLYILLFKMNK